MSDSNLQYISLSDAAKYSEVYSQEYLSLRARQGKFKATKLGRNWVTTKQWVDEYIHAEKNVKANGIIHEEVKPEIKKVEESVFASSHLRDSSELRATAGEVEIQQASFAKQKNNFVFPKYIFKFALASSVATFLIFTAFTFHDKIITADKNLDAKFLSIAKNISELQETANEKIDLVFANLKDSFLQQNDLTALAVVNGYKDVGNYFVLEKQKIKLLAVDEYKLLTKKIKRIKKELNKGAVVMAGNAKEFSLAIANIDKTLDARFFENLSLAKQSASSYFSGIKILANTEVKLPAIKLPAFENPLAGVFENLKSSITKSQEATNNKVELAFANLKSSFIEKNNLTAIGVVDGTKKTGSAFLNLKDNFVQQNDLAMLGVGNGFKNVGGLLVSLRNSFLQQNNIVAIGIVGGAHKAKYIFVNNYEKASREFLSVAGLAKEKSDSLAFDIDIRNVQKAVSNYSYGMPLMVKDYFVLQKQKLISGIKDYKLSTIETTKEISKEVSAFTLAIISNFDQHNIKNNTQDGLAIVKEKTKSLFANIKAFTIYIGENVQRGVEIALRPWLEKSRTVVILDETNKTSGGQTSVKPAEGRPPLVQITKETTRETITQTIVSKIDSEELAKLKNQITELQNLANKVQYYSPSNNVATSPVYIGSSGLEISGNAVLASLGVSGSASARDLSAGNSFSVGSGSTILTVDKYGHLTAPRITSGSISSASISSTGSITATGDLAISGSANISGNLNVGGIAVFSTSTIAMTTTTASIFSIGTSTTANLFTVAGSGNIVFQNTGQVYIVPTGTTTIGASTSTPTIITGYLASDILPYYDNTYNIGSSAYKWKQGYFGDILSVTGSTSLASLTASGTSTLATTTATYLAVSGATTIGSTLNVSGTSSLATTSATLLTVSGNSLLATTSISSLTIAKNGVALLEINSDSPSSTFVGLNAGRANTITGAGDEGLYNVFVGSNVGRANTTGYQNSVLGANAFYTNTTGYLNSAVGAYALQKNTTGYFNSAVGTGALQENTEGNSNTAMGMNALYSNTTGGLNTAMGLEALYVNISGSSSVAIGPYALHLNNGSFNTAIGQRAGDNITTGSNNIIIGYNIDAPSAVSSNQLNIGNIVYGNLATGNVGFGTSSYYGKLTVEGDSYFIGNSTTTGNLTVNGNLKVAGNSITLGDSFTSDLVVNTAVASDLIPDENATRDLGSTNYYWDYLYLDHLVANNISAASTTIGGTQGESFTLNSDNSSIDTESQSLIFFRGQVVPNAVLSWNALADKFDFNQPVFMQNDSSTTTVPSLEVWGVAGQTADFFRVASSSGAVLFNVASSSAVGIAGNLNIAGNITVGGIYNISSTSTQATTSISQLLVSGNSILSGGLWVNGTSTLATTTATLLSISGNGLVSGYLTVGTTTQYYPLYVSGNSYFAGNSTTTGNSQIAGNLQVNGSQTIGSTLNIVATSTQATTSISQLLVSGNSILSSGLWTTGTSTLATTSISLLTVSLNGTVAGNFGIGTTTPSSKLSISGTAGSKLLDIGFSTGTSTLQIDGSGLLTLTLGDNSSTSMVIQEGTNAYLTFDTSNDGEKIVVGKNLEVGQMNIDPDSGAVNFADMAITSTSVTSTVNSLSIALDGNAVLTAYGESTGHSGILQNLRVGIGTTTPIAMLSIAGNAYSTGPLLRISTSTTEALFIDGMGLVGIGTTSPIAMLSVRGGTNATAPLFRVSTTSIEAFYIDPTGKIGIGTTTPYYSLDILARSGIGTFRIASSSAYNTLLIDNNGLLTFGLADNSSTSMSIAEGTNSYLTFDTSNDAEKIVVGKDLEVGIMNIDQDSGAVRFTDMSVTASSTAGTANSLSIGIDGISVLTVYSSSTGNGFIEQMRVGIGTTTPLAMLDVVSSASTTGALMRVATSTGDKFFIDGMGLIGVATNTPSFALTVAGTQYTTGATYLGSTLNITGTSTQATTSITLLTVSGNGTVAGNFGIGTTTPSSKLSISGTAGSKLLDIGFSTGTSTLAIDGSGLLTISLGDNSSTSMVIQEGTNTYLTFDTSNDGEKIVVGKNLEVGQINVDADSGNVQFANMDVSTSAVTSTAESLSISIDGQSIITAYAEAMGNGFVQNYRVGIGTSTPIAMLSIAGNASTTGPMLRISTSTVEALFIDGMGLVGIGTTSPIAMLSVRGGTNATAPLFRVSTTSIEAFYIDPTGKIGIGTTTPYYSLDILARSGIGTFRIASSSAYNTLLIDNNGLLTFGLGDNSSTSMVIQEGTNTYLTFDTSNDDEKIVVGKNLEVGPMAIDQDSGAVRFANMNITASSTVGTVNSLSIGLDQQDVLTVYGEGDGNGMLQNFRVGIGTSTPIAMLTVIGNASTTGGLLKIATSTINAMFIDGMGNVGIGTTSPNTFMLEVAGNVGPSANSTYNLGSASRRWATFYASTTWAQYINTGDLIFANNFRFTEAPASSSQQILYLSNQNNEKVLTIKEDGSLEIGSPEKPAGITLYDEDTHEPYCLKMKSGAMVSVPGKCGEETPPAPAPVSEPALEETVEPIVEPTPVVEEPVAEPVLEPAPVVEEPAPVPEPTPSSEALAPETPPAE